MFDPNNGAAPDANPNLNGAHPPTIDTISPPVSGADAASAIGNTSYTETSIAQDPLQRFNVKDLQIQPESVWPPPVFMKPDATAHERHYIEQRWYGQWKFMDKKASDSKNKYFFWQGIVVIGSVTVPVLVSLDPDLIGFFFLWALSDQIATSLASTLIDFATVFISLSVAIAAAVEGLNKFGENWASYRQAAEDLMAEKSMYDVNAGRYAGIPNKFGRFVERTEEIIAQQNGRFIQQVEKQQQEQQELNDEVRTIHNNQFMDTLNRRRPYADEVSETVETYSNDGSFTRRTTNIEFDEQAVIPGKPAPSATIPVDVAPMPVMVASSVEIPAEYADLVSTEPSNGVTEIPAEYADLVSPPEDTSETDTQTSVG